ncbi:MAG: hypothetical protein KAQ98_14730 [Bacteriovoracaceae bacterium]|nr:hypothetical protein [Bacteriovoracaceae bacterium]
MCLLFMVRFAYASHSRTLHIDENLNWNENWVRRKMSDDENILRLLRILKRSDIGAGIIRMARSRAHKRGSTLLDVINIGEGSTADTTLIRKFFPDNPEQIIYEVRASVYINRHLPLMDAVLDLSHELTHFIYRPPFNPYKDDFNLEKFVRSIIEGKGGEVDAYMAECNVLREIFSDSNRYHANCERLIDPSTGTFSRERGAELFYRTGKHLEAVKMAMSEQNTSLDNFPYLSNEEAVYISSAYGVPYPMAAVMEYNNIMTRVCFNDKKRLFIVKNKIKRLPASIQKNSKVRTFNSMLQSFNVRCKAL